MSESILLGLGLGVLNTSGHEFVEMLKTLVVPQGSTNDCSMMDKTSKVFMGNLMGSSSFYGRSRFLHEASEEWNI